MKHKFLIQAGIILFTFLVIAFGVRQAHAAVGCFSDTNGHWAETYICWMAENNITSGCGTGIYCPNANVTRAEMAVFMQRQAEVPPTTGNIYINSGLNNWVSNGAGSGYVTYYTNLIELHAPAAGSYGFQFTPDLPAALYGRLMYTHSVKLCYDATLGASITGVYFRQYAGGATPGFPPYREITDTTVRTDVGCRTYAFPTDGSLFGTDHVVLYISTSFTGASDYIAIGATTFTLVPSAAGGILAPEDASEARSDMPASQPAGDGEAGAAP